MVEDVGHMNVYIDAPLLVYKNRSSIADKQHDQASKPLTIMNHHPDNLEFLDVQLTVGVTTEIYPW